ncbi:hypothetical protein BW686_06205 [Pseudomonas syringae]|uniref:DUF1534 domain-containing protein n=1 Tax=Pseudomonas syringae TaxID=317 RepID=A0A244EUR4_PSESX|nr:hypothetical protein BW686_06205 [Pseudomonas syringae]
MRLSFRTLQRGNACRDAARHPSAPQCVFKIGRKASAQFNPSLPRRVERSSARVLTGPIKALRSFSLTLS